MELEQSRDQGKKIVVQGRKIRLKLKGIYMNARSIRNKVNEFKSYVEAEDLDIIIVTETWVKYSRVEGNTFSERDQLSEFQINRYELFSYERKGREGGGGGALSI